VNDENEPGKTPAEKSCGQCGEPMVLVTTIGKFDDQPAYQIFRCSLCEVTDWVRE
jgi:hypothetical protein